MKPLILVDASSYFFRAFHALPPLVNHEGQATGAIYGVVNMIRRLIKDYMPEDLGIVFDTKGKTFREDLYPAYKAHRPPMPVELSSQFEPLVALLKAMGLPLIMIEGVEADDVIGTLTQQALAEKRSVLISTGDKDFAQLVNENVTLLNTMSNQTLNPAGVVEKFGVKPAQFIDYLALMGDTVDNVPGVPKCGPKTAAKWIATYGSLESVMAHAAEVSGKIGESLRASLPMLPLSKQLVTIKQDVALDFHLDDLKLKVPDLEHLQVLLQKLGFKSWLKELLEGRFFLQTSAAPSLQKRASYQTINTQKAWQTFYTALKKAHVFCIDTETTSLNPLDAQLVGIALAITSPDAVYIPLQHTEKIPQLSVEAILADLKPLLEDKNKLKVGQNLKYDYRVLKQYDITMQGMAYDTMLESYLFNSSATRHDMDTLSLKYLSYQPQSYLAVTDKGKKCFNEVSIEAATFYAAEDADITLQLHHAIYPKLTPVQVHVLETIEMPLVSVLGDMEDSGVLIDENILKAQGVVLKKEIHLLEKEAYALVGRDFNLQSPTQLQAILFEEQGLPVVEKTPKGQPSTAESALQALSFTYRLPAVILSHRRLTKLVSTYIDALPKRIHPKTHRVHTSFNQAVTATGRLSSSEPNLQNIPIRSEEGRAIRRAFIAARGQVLLSADYSQIELRLMAELSQDPRLINAFEKGLDIHTATAAEIFSIPLEAVTSEHRRQAKAVNFGLIYGMSAFGLSKQLGIDRHEADKYVKTYFDRYPGVLAYMERTRELARQHGYVETLFGRRLYVPDIRAPQIPKQKAAERMAINGPMQGSAADLIKLAMIALAQWQRDNPHQMTLILQVHDELVFEVERSALGAVKAIVKEKMEQVIQLSVPLLVSIGVGENWEEAH